MTKKRDLRQFDLKLVHGFDFLIGVDEAGRGAVAGPVIAAAVMAASKFLEGQLAGRLAKRLTVFRMQAVAEREALAAELQVLASQGSLKIGFGAADTSDIDTLNILGASKLAMARALEKLHPPSAFAPTPTTDLFTNEADLTSSSDRVSGLILIDGLALRSFPYPHQGIIKGDARSLCVAMAAVLAKVQRDKLMIAIDRLHPGYGFAENKGYGTQEHGEAILRKGKSSQHREAFLRKLLGHVDLPETIDFFESSDIGPMPAVETKVRFRNGLKRDGPRPIGRDDLFIRLDALALDPAVKVLSLTGLGGEGKTTVVMHWLKLLAERGWVLGQTDSQKGHRYERVFVWSFYEQGARSLPSATADGFFHEAIRFFGTESYSEVQGTPNEQAARLAGLIGERPSLLVLDGLEVLQEPPGPRTGRLKDSGLESFLNILCRTQPTASYCSLCVITSRTPVPNLTGYEGSSAPLLQLNALTEEESIRLIQRVSAFGANLSNSAMSDTDLRAVSQNLGGHALSLELVGAFLQNAKLSDVQRPLSDFAGKSQLSRNLENLLTDYEEWMRSGGEDGVRQLMLLRILSLFDGHVDLRWIAALRDSAVIAGLTEPLVVLSSEDITKILGWLLRVGLITGDLLEGQPADPSTPQMVSPHPMVRHFFAAQLRKEFPLVFQAAHRRLYEYFRDLSIFDGRYAPAHIDYLYRAVAHGCEAGLVRDSFEEVYWPKLWVGDWEPGRPRERDLEAVARFFTNPWTQPSSAIDPQRHIWLLIEAGRCLQAVGRMTEAAEALAAGLVQQTAVLDISIMAVVQRNLAELCIATGECYRALDHAQRALHLDEQTGELEQTIRTRETIAHCLDLLGHPEDAQAIFAEANLRRSVLQHIPPMLDWIGFYRHCDCLLVQSERIVWQHYLGFSPPPEATAIAAAACDEVVQLAEDLLGRVSAKPQFPDSDLCDFAYARARFFQAILTGADFAGLPARLDKAVQFAARLGYPELTVSATLTRAWMHAHAGDAMQAHTDLKQALVYATRQGLKVAQADVHLYAARLHRTESDLDEARRIVSETGYKRRNGEIADAQDSFLTPSVTLLTNQAEKSARDRLAAGDFRRAAADLETVLLSDPSRKRRICEEFGCVFSFAREPAAVRPQPHPPSDAQTWRWQIWRLLSRRNAFVLSAAETAPPPHQIAVAANEAATSASKVTIAKTTATPEQKGEALERAVERLLRSFFSVGDEIPWKIRRQKRGSQGGHDLSIEWSGKCDLASGPNLCCHIECKNYQDQITTKEVGEKLLVEPKNPPLIDHWILISPHSNPSNDLNRVLEEQRREGQFPFTVQIWSPETGIAEFFGLEPEVYDEFYPTGTLDPHPLTWDEPTRNAVRARWLARLKPQLHLPRGWSEYLRDPFRLCSPPEDAAKLAHTYEYYVPLGCRNATGALLENPLHTYIAQWLEQPAKSVLFLLGEFGDGKTCFTYTLSRQLVATLAENPKQAWLPLRLTLKKFPGNPREFLRQRLEEFHAEVGGWLELSKSFRRLVILDGFDEMSVRLDPAAITQNITALLACVKEFDGCKVLITSRTHFFENRQDVNRLMARLGHPSILHLAPIERRHVLQNTERYLTKILGAVQAQEKILRLSQLNDPVGLACKPLFLEMLKDVLSSPDEPQELEVVDLYEHYIEQALQRKVELLDDPEFRADPVATTDNLRRILGEIAEDLQRSGAAHVALSRFQSREERPFAQLLWRLSGGPELDQDARARIGSRSLLGRVPAKEGEGGWLVDFCHRSLREYFVALRLCAAFGSSDQSARAFLREVPLNHEILHFAVERWRKFGSTGVPERLLAILKEAVPQNSPGKMGGCALTLLLRLNKNLPRDFDWRGKILDGADLEEADLSGLDFSHSSFRHANLANSILEDANFEHCDLSGVRIEETRTVAALAAGPSGSEGLVLYGDGILREWALKPGTKLATTVVASIPPDPEAKVGVHLSGQFWAISQQRWIFFERGRAPWTKLGEFPLTNIYKSFRPQSTRITCLRTSETNQVQFTSLTLDKLTRTTLRKLDPTRHFAELGEDAFLWSDPAVGFLVARRSDPATAEPHILACPPNITCLDVYPLGSRRHLVLLGCEDGQLLLWRLDFGTSTWAPESLLRLQSHNGPVTAVAFAGEDRILSGGADRTIILRKINSGAKAECPVEGRFQLTVRCRGLRIQGVKGPAEYERLQAYISQQAQ